jgi:Spy/CpxP family protein refolding chaperone
MMGGYGQGPGMMGGYGHGSGMMGGYGYGPGMMGGDGGPGMMRGYGGPGWDRSGGGFAALDLTDDQRRKLAAVREQVRSKSWDTMGRLHAEHYKLRELLRGETVDPSAVADQQQKVDELRRQILKSRLEARNEMVAVLTPEQKQRLREHGPWWHGEGVEP